MTTNTTGITVPHPPAPARTGQATAIEQSRAGAEVYAAVLVAQQCPRNTQLARVAAIDSCRMAALAERAFFRYSRGGQQITGPSVHLARELARCWGNVQYGINELRRDDEHKQSEMLAFAWDVQTNTRASAIFIVPHKRDRQGGPVDLVDMRDVYENNANAGARRVRECIFNVLPPWLTEEAQETCRATLNEGGGLPLVQRIANMIAHFATIGVSETRLAAKMGRSSAQWTPEDLAQLAVVYRSIKNNEATVDQEFPPATAAVTAAAIEASGQAPDAADAPPVPPAAKPSAKKLTAVHAWFTRHNVPDDDKHSYISALVAREITSTKELTDAETTALLTQLDRIATEDDPLTALQEIAAEYYERPAGTGSDQ